MESSRIGPQSSMMEKSAGTAWGAWAFGWGSDWCS
jgi:hypothetical protein